MITYDMITFSCSRFQIFRGNTNAYNYAAIQRVDYNIRARAVRLIPIDSVVQACMRIQICGKCKSCHPTLKEQKDIVVPEVKTVFVCSL